MGTLIALSIDAPTQAASVAGLEAAWEGIQCVESLMHPARANSDVARLHAAGEGDAVSVHPWTHEVLRLAQLLHRDSHGVFDPCLPEAPGRLGDLELRPDGTVCCRAPLRLDLGGIAKGYAVDRAIEALVAAGCDAALINAGGDLRVHGARAELVDMGRPGALRLRLADAALAVSGDSAAGPPEHRGFYCRAPRYLRVARAAAVIAPTAAVADALTKCALFLPPEECSALLARHGARQIQLL